MCIIYIYNDIYTYNMTIYGVYCEYPRVEGISPWRPLSRLIPSSCFGPCRDPFQELDHDLLRHVWWFQLKEVRPETTVRTGKKYGILRDEITYLGQ